MNRDLPLEPIDERVRVVARAFAYPPTPDIAGAAQRRLAEGGSRSTQARGPAALAPRLRLTWVVVALLVALLTAGALFVPEVQAVVRAILRIGSIEIVVATPTPGASPATTPSPASSVLNLTGETTLEDAQRHMSFPIWLPSYPH